MFLRRGLTAAIAGALAGCGPGAVTEPAGPGALETTAAPLTTLSYLFHPDRPRGGALVGFGGQLNQNLYAVAGQVPASSLPEIEGDVRALAPQHVRVFFGSQALGDPDLMASFLGVLGLAQKNGTTANVTWWHGPYSGASGTTAYGQAEMHAFAGVLYDALVTHGLTALQYVTIQNEVNSTSIQMADYVQLYRHLDAELKALGIRGAIQLVGGDLVRLGGTRFYGDWLDYLARNASDVLDGYSVHIYWAFPSTDTQNPADDGIAHLEEAAAFVQGFTAGKGYPANAVKPLYVTEFGVRGWGWGGGQQGFAQQGCKAPGPSCTAIGQSNTGALYDALFLVTAARLGVVAALKWDVYWAMYDRTFQDWSMIGPPVDGLPLRPSYPLFELFTHAVSPGWHAVEVGSQQITPPMVSLAGFVSPDGASQTVFAVNRGAAAVTLALGGLSPHTGFHHVAWNWSSAASGSDCYRPMSVTNSQGATTATLPAQSVMALSSRSTGVPGLVPCP